MQILFMCLRVHVSYGWTALCFYCSSAERAGRPEEALEFKWSRTQLRDIIQTERYLAMRSIFCNPHNSEGEPHQGKTLHEHKGEISTIINLTNGSFLPADSRQRNKECNFLPLFNRPNAKRQRNKNRTDSVPAILFASIAFDRTMRAPIIES